MSYFDPPLTDIEAYEATKKFFINRLEELEDESFKAINIISDCNSKILALLDDKLQMSK